MSAPKIITTHVCPPIPVRSFDWCAYLDGREEDGPKGWGATEAEAIADLRENCEDWPRRCKTNIVDPQDGSCWHCHAAQGSLCRDGAVMWRRREAQP